MTSHSPARSRFSCNPLRSGATSPETLDVRRENCYGSGVWWFPAMDNNELRFTYRGRGVGASVAPRRATRPGRPPWVVTVDGLGTHFGPPCRDGEPEPITIDRIATWLDQRFHDLK